MEADAKRLQSKEEELLKRKEALRNRLAQLRKERKDLRAAIEVNAGMRFYFVLYSALDRLSYPNSFALCAEDKPLQEVWF